MVDDRLQYRGRLQSDAFLPMIFIHFHIRRENTELHKLLTKTKLIIVVEQSRVNCSELETIYK